MPATKTTADAALKEDYQPLVREQINQDIPLLTYVEKNTKDTDGRRAVLSLHVTRNSGIGSRAEGGTLPTAGNQGYAEERISLKYHYGRIQLSGPLMRAADSDKGAFERAMQGETRRVVDDLKRDMNRQVWGTSNGVIAAADASSVSTKVFLASTATDVQVRQLEIGMLVDIGTVAAPTGRTSANAIVSVTDNTASGGQSFIVLTSAVGTTTSQTDFIFRSGNGGDATNSSQKEVTGMQTIVAATGSLFNVDPTTYPVWAATVDSNSGTNRSISENLMARVVQNTQIKGGTYPNLCITHHGVFRAYANLLTSLKRFTNTVNLKGGYASGLPFSAGGGGDLPVVVDRDAPANQMFFIDTTHLTEFMASDWEFMQEDGAVLQRVIGVDAYEAVLFKYMELATDKRNAHGLLKDITAA